MKEKASELMFNGEKFVTCLGTPDHFVGTVEDVPDDFFWKANSGKKYNRWIMRRTAIELGLIYE